MTSMVTISAVWLLVTAIVFSQQAFAGVTPDKQSSSTESKTSKSAFEPFTSSIDKEIQKDIFKREMPDPTSLPPWDPAHIIDYEDCDANKTRCKVAAILHSFNDLQCDDLTDCEWATPVSCTKYIQVPLSGYGDRYEIKCVPDTCQYDTKGKCVCGG